jgi:hypothetical protein
VKKSGHVDESSGDGVWEASKQAHVAPSPDWGEMLFQHLEAIFIRNLPTTIFLPLYYEESNLTQTSFLPCRSKAFGRFVMSWQAGVKFLHSKVIYVFDWSFLFFHLRFWLVEWIIHG